MSISITIDGDSYAAEDGEPLANVLFREQLIPVRKHPIDKTPRAPFCMMGVCFECLVEVSGQRAVQACLTPVTPGMIVKRDI